MGKFQVLFTFKIFHNSVVEKRDFGEEEKFINQNDSYNKRIITIHHAHNKF